MFDRKPDVDDLFKESRLDNFRDRIEDVLYKGLYACEWFKDEKIEPRLYNFRLRKTELDKIVRQYNRPKTLSQAKQKVMISLSSIGKKHNVKSVSKSDGYERKIRAYKQVFSLNGKEIFIIKDNAIIDKRGLVVALIEGTTLFGVNNPVFAIRKPLEVKEIIGPISLDWEDIMLYGGIDEQGRLFKGMNQKNVVAKVN